MKSLNLNIRRLIFSSRCSICRSRDYDKGSYLCYNCYEKIKKKIQLRSKGNLYYTTYYDTDIKRLISSLKLRNRRYLCEFIGDLIREGIEKVIEERDIEVVLVVPLSKMRTRERGFNQVEEILKCAKVEYSSLERIRDTKPMHSILNKVEREKNVKGSFYTDISVDGKNVLIVDDIVTTGSTIREVISALRGKPKKITVFTFALAKTAIMNNVTF